MSKPPSFFRGSELPRLLVLFVILVVGMVWFWQYVYVKRMAPPPEEVATVPITPIVPDRSVEFESVTDRTSIGLRDSAAYAKLIKQVEDATPADLASRSRRDVLSIQIWDRPQAYRGVPIHLLGTVLRVMTYESKMCRSGRLYEAWMVTSDSQRNPYVCVFEDAPRGFPIGDNLSERVVFNGYFLKLMKYQSGKDMGFYTAPALIGRIGWNRPVATAADDATKPFRWMAIAVGLLFVLSFFRWMSGLRRALAPRSQLAIPRERPTEEISPEDLAKWVENVPSAEPGDRLEGGAVEGLVANEPIGTDDRGAPLF